jgi:hypothetical protein
LTSKSHWLETTFVKEFFLILDKLENIETETSRIREVEDIHVHSNYGYLHMFQDQIEQQILESKITINSNKYC